MSQGQESLLQMEAKLPQSQAPTLSLFRTTFRSCLGFRTFQIELQDLESHLPILISLELIIAVNSPVIERQQFLCCSSWRETACMDGRNLRLMLPSAPGWHEIWAWKHRRNWNGACVTPPSWFFHAVWIGPLNWGSIKQYNQFCLTRLGPL